MPSQPNEQSRSRRHACVLANEGGWGGRALNRGGIRPSPRGSGWMVDLHVRAGEPRSETEARHRSRCSHSVAWRFGRARNHLQAHAVFRQFGCAIISSSPSCLTIGGDHPCDRLILEPAALKPASIAMSKNGVHPDCPPPARCDPPPAATQRRRHPGREPELHYLLFCRALAARQKMRSLCRIAPMDHVVVPCPRKRGVLNFPGGVSPGSNRTVSWEVQ